MGLVGSKDDRGVRVLQALPPGFLDEKGKELRNDLDICLEQNGWYFTIAGLALTVPICFRYKTERPFYVAAILSPMADMYYGTLRCTHENEAFAQHYRYLHKRYQTPAWKQQPDEDDSNSQQAPSSWQQRQQQHQQEQLQPGSPQQQQQQQSGALPAQQQQQGQPPAAEAAQQEQQQQPDRSWWKRF